MAQSHCKVAHEQLKFLTVKSASTPPGITVALQCWNQGEKDALQRLIPLIYDELRMLAGHHLRAEYEPITLRPTELVHEAFLRLSGHRQPAWRNRAHFFGAVTELMRRILVDYARRRKAAKRQGKGQQLGHDEVPSQPTGFDFELLDQALTRLNDIDSRQARFIELRFFGALTLEECAEALDVSVATVKRDWLLARAWLLRQMSSGG
jgi:RNA polymerase sigma factor (TIGR02999 family)